MSRISSLLVAPLLLAIAASGVMAEERRAITIGISDYPKYPDDKRLRFAHSDALAFENLLRDHAGDVSDTLLINEKATREGILDAVADLKAAPRADAIFLFFSGHAELDASTGLYYLMPFGGDPSRLSVTAIQFDLLFKELEAAGAKTLVLFLDACHSGAALLGKGAPEDSLDHNLERMISRANDRTKGSTILFLSAGPEESSWEDERYGHGVFTHFLIKGLEGDADGVAGARDGQITASELKAYLDREVPQASFDLGKPRQTPFVNSAYNGSYVLTRRSSSSPAVTKITPRLSLAAIQNLRKSDKELALMLEVGAAKAGLASPEVLADMRAVSVERPVRTSMSLKVPIKLDSTTGWVISSDGSRLVGCMDPWTLLAIDLNTGQLDRKLDLSHAFAPVNRRLSIDSCDISISRDNRFVAVSIKADNGERRLTLLALSAESAPSFSVDDYQFGVFVADCLVLVGGRSTRAMKIGTWIDVPVVGKEAYPASAVAAEPDGSTVTIVGSSIQLFRYDAERQMLGLQVTTSRSGAPWINWIPTKNSFFSLPQICVDQHCRAFPSASHMGYPRQWQSLFQVVGEPAAVRFGDDDGVSDAISLGEPILTGRLLADGKAVVVGQKGSVFRLDSLRYGDCCTIPVTRIEDVSLFSAGTDGITAVLILEAVHKSRLEVFRRRTLIHRIPIDDEAEPRQIALSRSSRAVAIGSDSSVRVIRLSADGDHETFVKPLDCGIPMTFDATGLKVACVANGSGKVQYYNVLTGQVERELDGHIGPIQALVVDENKLTAAGAYSGRSQTLVTVWSLSNGKVLSQRSCRIEGAEKKPFGFLRHGSYLAQLETRERVVTRDALTCEDKNDQSAMRFGADSIRTATLADTVLIQQLHSSSRPAPDLKAVSTFNPFISGELKRWVLDLTADGADISPDGMDVVVREGARLLRIPITDAGAAEVAGREVTREFTKSECDQFFPDVPCPKVVSVTQRE